MKILFVISTYGPLGAGSGISVQNLAEGCAALGHEVVVLALIPFTSAAPYEETLNGVRILYRPIKNTYPLGAPPQAKWKKALWHILDLFNPFAALDTYKILKAEKPDIINTSVIAGFSTSIHTLARMMKIPLVHTLRDYYLMCQQNAMYRNGKTCERICTGCKPFMLSRIQTSKVVDLFLANSQYVADQHLKHGAIPKGIECIPQYNMNESDEIASPKPFPKDRPLRFGYIGRLHISKGLESLLGAYDTDALASTELKIAGDGDARYVETLKARAANRPNIEFLGRVKAEDFYNNIDVLICPSVYGEPLPRVVYEAYRYALPVIASDAGGTPEILDHGACGYIYPAGNERELQERMTKFLDDPAHYEALSEGAAEKAVAFTRKAILGQFTAHLTNVLQGKEGVNP